MKKLTNTGTMAMDERGKLGNHNTVSAEREAPVIEHIQQFLTVESHYVRRGCKWEYLPEELSVKEMHRMYKKYCAEKGYSKVESYDFYLQTFTSRFNLKFHKSKKDACDMCSIKENTPEEERSEEQIIAYKNHLNEKEAARKFKCDAKTKAAEDSQTVVAAFDFRKHYYVHTAKVPHFTTFSDFETTTSQLLTSIQWTAVAFFGMKLKLERDRAKWQLQFLNILLS